MAYLFASLEETCALGLHVCHKSFLVKILVNKVIAVFKYVKVMANSIMGNNAATFLIEIRECSLDAVRLTNLHALFESANRQRFLPTNDRMPNDIV